MRQQIALAFGDAPDSAVTVRLARIALAAIEGAFVSVSGRARSQARGLVEPLAPAVVGARRALLAQAR